MMPKIFPIDFEQLGLRPFAEVLDYQKELRRQRQAGEIADRVLFVEHPRVITRGRRPSDQDFRVSKEELFAQGFALEDAGRGGRLTYHGPGQLVAYFILSLKERRLGIPAFVCRIEAAVIQSLAEFGITAACRDGFPGVWVEGRKIASIGLSVDRGVSMNGVAVNVDPVLEDFSVIVPCGIENCQMTSMRKENSTATLPILSQVLTEQLRIAFPESELRNPQPRP